MSESLGDHQGHSRQIPLSVRETAPAVPGAAPASGELDDRGAKPSFAAVVGKLATVALVRTTEEGGKVVCHLPRSAGRRQSGVEAPSAVPPQQLPIKPAELDMDAIVASITVKVLQRVSSSLDSMISRNVSGAIAAAMPQIIEAVKTTLSASLGAPAGPSPFVGNSIPAPR